MLGQRDRKGYRRVATTITQSFRKFKTNLEITDLQATTVSTRQRNVREAMEKKMTVLDSFLTGSYARSTMIAPLKDADIDVFIVLGSGYFERDGQAALLDKVKRALRATYTKTPAISRDGQAVTITFTDFQVDVVPGFNRKGGGYLIPNTQGHTWISTNPKEHVRISGTHNKAHDQSLVPLVKMIKCWNRAIGHHFRSFHLEVLAWQVMNGADMTSYAQGMRYFLDKGRSAVTKKTWTHRDTAAMSGTTSAQSSRSRRRCLASRRHTIAPARPSTMN